METEIEFRDAIRDALDEELARETVIFFGEDVAVAGGCSRRRRASTKYGWASNADFGAAMTGAAFGAAVTGKRPVLEIMFGTSWRCRWTV